MPAQSHYTLPDPTTLGCDELRAAVRQAQTALAENEAAVANADMRRAQADADAAAAQAEKHAAAEARTKHLSERPVDDSGATYRRWETEQAALEAKVVAAGDRRDAAVRRGDEAFEERRQLHEQQSVIRRWLNEAIHQQRERCPEEPPAQERARVSKRLVVGALVAVAVVVAGAGGAISLAGGGDQPEPEPQALHKSFEPVDTSPPSTTTTTAAPAPAGPAPKVSGRYRGSVTVDDDPAGHACCVKPHVDWDVLQRRDTGTGEITIVISHVVEGVRLSSPLAATGAEFRAVGLGTVAGYPNTEVAFEGTVTLERGLRGTLTVGGNGTLPRAKAITFTVEMAKAA